MQGSFLVRLRRGTFYRAMRPDHDGLPRTERSARGLGVRHGTDIPVVDGQVTSGQGGMSLAIGSPDLLPSHRRPLALGGTGKDPVYRYKRRHLPKELVIRRDPGLEGHAFLEPAGMMPIEDYEQALTSTRQRWRRIIDA